jgi:hypothetical protein
MELLNHHSAAVLPYCIKNGTHYFIFEQKDSKYKIPYFNRGFNFLGGNWKKGIDRDNGPQEVVEREIREEFFACGQRAENLNSLLGQNFIQHIQNDYENNLPLSDVREVSKILSRNLEHVLDLIVTVKPPITKSPLVYGSSIFLRKLDQDGFDFISNLLMKCNGKITTDNLEYGSSTIIKTLDEINDENSKFSWGYDKVLNYLMPCLDSPLRVIRTLDLVDIRLLDNSLEAKSSKIQSFADVENAGYSYLLDKK